MTVLVLMENNAASSLSSSSLTALPQQQRPYTASFLSFADVATVNHSCLLTVTPSQTVYIHLFPTFLSTLPFMSLSLVYLQYLILQPTHFSPVSLLISQGGRCDSAQLSQCALGLETKLCNTEKETEEKDMKGEGNR